MGLAMSRFFSWSLKRFPPPMSRSMTIIAGVALAIGAILTIVIPVNLAVALTGHAGSLITAAISDPSIRRYYVVGLLALWINGIAFAAASFGCQRPVPVARQVLICCLVLFVIIGCVFGVPAYRYEQSLLRSGRVHLEPN